MKSRHPLPLTVAQGHVCMMTPLPTYEGFSADVDGHRLSVAVTGADRLAAIIELISGAQHSLRLFFYIFSDDDVGQKVRGALIEALRRGVDVTLLIDGFGSSDRPDAAFEMLVAEGATFGRFNSVWGRRYLLRNHQKIIVSDEKRALVGGSNIAAPYFADAPDGNSWHDLILCADGPIAARLASYFDALKSWTLDGDRSMRGLVQLLARHSDKGGPLRWMFGGPFRRMSPLTRAVKADIDSARQFDMVQAYFAPNWGMLRRLGRVKSRRGGAVRLLTAARSDSQTTLSAARHCYKRLLRGGVSIYEYLPQNLHMKLIVADNVVYVGSANFDMRSLFINAEIMLRIDDAAFAASMRALIDAHVPHSDAITREEHSARSTPLARLRWLVSYFIVSTVDFTVTRRINLRRI